MFVLPTNKGTHPLRTNEYLHPAERAITSDQSVSTFIMIVSKRKSFRSECSSCYTAYFKAAASPNSYFLKYLEGMTSGNVCPGFKASVDSPTYLVYQLCMSDSLHERVRFEWWTVPKQSPSKLMSTSQLRTPSESQPDAPIRLPKPSASDTCHRHILKSSHSTVGSSQTKSSSSQTVAVVW